MTLYNTCILNDYAEKLEKINTSKRLQMSSEKQIPEKTKKKERERLRKQKKRKKQHLLTKKMIFKHSATFPSFDSFKCKSERKSKGRKKTNPSC